MCSVTHVLCGTRAGPWKNKNTSPYYHLLFEAIPTARPRARELRCVAHVVPSECQGVTQRPRSDEKRTLRTVGVAPVACRSQQTRATVPWWRRSPRHMRSLCSSCAPLAEDLRHTRSPSTTAPHRPADASRFVPIAGGEIELALLCATAQGTLPASGKARCARCARRDCPGAPPSPSPAHALAPRCRVADLHERVRTRPWL